MGAAAARPPGPTDATAELSVDVDLERQLEAPAAFDHSADDALAALRAKMGLTEAAPVEAGQHVDFEHLVEQAQEVEEERTLGQLATA